MFRGPLRVPNWLFCIWSRIWKPFLKTSSQGSVARTWKPFLKTYDQYKHWKRLVTRKLLFVTWNIRDEQIITFVPIQVYGPLGNILYSRKFFFLWPTFFKISIGQFCSSHEIDATSKWLSFFHLMYYTRRRNYSHLFVSYISICNVSPFPELKIRIYLQH